MDKSLLAILRCPVCVNKKSGVLELKRGSWLICPECSRKYPIFDGIPVVHESAGDKWLNFPESELPKAPSRDML